MEINEEKENRELLALYRKLLRKSRPMIKDGEVALIKKAFRFAMDAHKDMRRRSGEPYIFHPMEVALIVGGEMGLDSISIAAAFLHDVVEDTSYTVDDIKERFGPKVSYIIDGLTKMKASEKLGINTSMQAENFRKMLLTISSDIRVVLIKIADRLHNMRTLDSMPRDKKLRIRSETSYIYAPLAHRLGLYAIKSELEDLGLKYSDPEAYNSITTAIKNSKADRVKFFQNFVRPIKMGLRKTGLVYAIKMRMKSIYSIYRKMQSQEIPFEQIYDFLAIRIIVKGDVPDERRSCWEVYSAVTDVYTPNTNRLRDWISMPRENGYQSLHVTVMGPHGHWVEVQIRTERMDEIAEKGFAAHWKYKENTKSSTGKKRRHELGLEEWIARIRELIEAKDIDALEFIDTFRASLYQEEVYAFTPKGDLKRFPQGASVLDFAFEIHTEVGARCLGAKVNGRLVPLSQKLMNGDQVEILTSNIIKANEDWLKYVVTTRARTKIKEYIKEEQRRVGSLGKEVVERKFKSMKMPFTERNMALISQYFGYDTEAAFFYDIGTGKFNHIDIKKFKDHVEDQEQAKKMHPESAKEFRQTVKEMRHNNDDELVIGEDKDRLEYSIAECCKPIPGDGIFGFITVGKGIKVHRSNCSNAISLMANYGHRVIKARWADQKETFDANLIIEGTDRTGLVHDVTRVISSQMKLNMKSINMSSEAGIFRGVMQLSVSSKQELEMIIGQLEGIEGVLHVLREEIRG